MLHFGLVLLVATSAFAAPSYDTVSLNLVPLEEAGTRNLFDQVLNLVDGGDVSTNTLTLETILLDISGQRDSASQAITLAQTIGTILPLSTGSPGDVCASASVINAWTKAVHAGNPAYARPAIVNFVDTIANSLGQIVNLVQNPERARFTTGIRGDCPAEGRTYNLESAWDSILDFAKNQNTHSFLYEQYCVVKRLYLSLYKTSNNIGAVATASSLPPVQSVYRLAAGPVLNFLRAVVTNTDTSRALAGAQQALKQAVREIKL